MGVFLLQAGWLTAVLMAVGAVILINGWTDAPTAIAVCVTSGALSERRAGVLAAVCNLLGLGLFMAFRPAVAATVQGMVRLPEGEPLAGLAVLLSALIATGLWALVAWGFGIPTSESHALLAGLSGAATAYGGVGCVDPAAWTRVLLGLVLSLMGGVLLGGLFRCLLERGRRGRSPSTDRLRGGLVFGACATAFLHGAQDGQKFVGLWLLAFSLADRAADPLSLSVPCALLMGLGTLLGGGRIIRTVGERLVRTDARDGVAADLGAAVCLGALTFFGWPVSTTHVKTAAIAGTGIAKGRGRTDVATAVWLVLAWILTFPACFGAGFACMRWFLFFF